MDFNDRHKHLRDERLCFDVDTHTYTVGGLVYRSVTTMVEDCFEKFDAEYWASRKATPGRTKEMIMREWAAKGEEARNLGTQMHERIESYYLGRKVDGWLGDPTFRLFAAFACDYRLVPYRSEWRIYHEESRVAGTLDFLAERPDGTLEIWDWKRSTKLTDSPGRPITDNAYGRCGYGAAASLPDCTYWHYALQVSVYRYILEIKYDLPTAAAHLGVFHPDCRRYHVIDLPYLRKEAEALLTGHI